MKLIAKKIGGAFYLIYEKRNKKEPIMLMRRFGPDWEWGLFEFTASFYHLFHDNYPIKDSDTYRHDLAERNGIDFEIG